MAPIADQLPRIFQANLDRLFRRVILPGMSALPLHAGLPKGNLATLEEGLDRAAAQVDNHTANEAAKVYALTLAAVFERQMNIWMRSITTAQRMPLPKTRGFQDLLPICAGFGKIDLTAGGLGDDLMQLCVVANVVRHGEGPSRERLHEIAPDLWDDGSSDYQDLLAGPSTPSEQLLIREQDILRYIRATTRFWGLADPQPGADAEPRYWEGM